MKATCKYYAKIATRLKPQVKVRWGEVKNILAERLRTPPPLPTRKKNSLKNEVKGFNTMAMTDKKRAFADSLLSGAAKNISNREAAIEAGYSEATASQMGSKLAKDKDVLRYMAQQKLNNSQAVKAEVKPTGNLPIGAADPKDALLRLLNDPDPDIALKAAKALMPYMYARIAPAGKKEGEKQSAIEATKTGRFATLSQQSDKIQ